MLKIAHAVSFIVENEPDAVLIGSDDINFNALSNRTLSLVHKFVFSTERMVIQKVGVKKAEKVNLQSSILVASKDDSAKNVSTLNIDALVAAFSRKMNLNYDIGMPAIIGQAPPSLLHSREVVSLSDRRRRRVQSVITCDIGDLIQLFNRNWFDSSVDLRDVNDAMANSDFGKNEIVQINMPTIEGHPTTSFLVSRDLLMQLVCFVLNIGRGYEPADITSNSERATITEIHDDIDNSIDLIGESDYHASGESESSSDESLERPLSPNSLDAALFALYNNDKVDAGQY